MRLSRRSAPFDSGQFNKFDRCGPTSDCTFLSLFQPLAGEAQCAVLTNSGIVLALARIAARDIVGESSKGGVEGEAGMSRT
jgi:hypothetical protein